MLGVDSLGQSSDVIDLPTTSTRQALMCKQLVIDYPAPRGHRQAQTPNMEVKYCDKENTGSLGPG